MRAKQLFKFVFVSLLLAGFTYTALAGPPDPQPDKSIPDDSSEVQVLTLDGIDGKNLPNNGPFLSVPNSPSYLYETETNDTFETANALPGSSVVMEGNIFPVADADFFSFTGNAGDRVYAATMTSFDASASGDSTLQLLSTDGVTILETDLNDGSFNASSSTIAGLALPASGTYYLRVTHNVTISTIRPYALYLQVQNGAPTAEVEANNDPANANPLPVNGWVSGAIDPAADVDFFSFSANAGDTVFLSLDLDPERDVVTWNGRLGIALFGNPPANQILTANDASVTSPNSEAMFMTIKTAGTYYAYVDMPTGVGGATQTYHLSVSVLPAVSEGAVCTTYTSTDVPQIIPTGPGMVSSTIVVPGNPRISDLNVSIQLDHTFMQDLDVHLRSPQGNDNGIFTDIGAATVGGLQTQMDLIFNDEAAIPPAFALTTPMELKPELAYRLNWFDGEDAGGTWTLDIRDDVTGDGGTLNGWSMTICEPEPPPVCPPGTAPTTIFTTDFEANDGGFTHSGTQDEWGWGLPTFAPITTCNSGTNCWKTDLANTYNASSSQNLLSPNIDLTGYLGPVLVTWAQKSQIESASFDHSTVTVQQAGGTNPTILWQWLDATQTNLVGNPSTTIQESSGWALHTANISNYAGQNIELLYHLDSDTSVQYAGLAIDDVTVTACAPVPEISLAKTVGTDPSTCAATNSIATVPGTDVTYCYEITNTGLVTLTQHTLVDSALGTLLNDFPYPLGPGASAFITATANITTTTINTATWTAYNPGPINLVSATDVATVTISSEPLLCNAAPVAFESGIPADWTIVDNTGGTGIVWVSTTDAACGIANLTNGSGEAVCADSDHAGSGAPAYNTELVSNAFDLTGYDSITLDVAAYYRDLGTGNDLFKVDVWDGTTWTNELTWDTSHMPGDINLDLSSYSGLTGVQVRFTYAGDGWDWYAEVDNVALTCANLSQPPVIEVSPATLNSTQPTDTVITQTLTISNTGEDALTWTVAEDASIVVGSQTVQAIPVSPAGTTDSRTPTTSPQPAPRNYTSPANFSEDFADITNLPGWFMQNNSNPLGTTNWFQGNTTVFSSQAGDPTAYIGANFNNTAGVGTISNWLLTPELTLSNGDTFSFWTRQPTASTYPDRLQLRLSTAGSSTNVGSGAEDVGDFTTLLLDINPTLSAGVYPDVWTQFTVTLSGIPNGVTGRFAFRYYVTSGGPNGSNSDYIGIDTVEYVQNVLPGVCDIPSDIPWLSVTPITGTIAGGASTNASVIFDATGLSAGVYTGTLCLNSNDPLTPLVTVPLTLTVEGVPTYGVALSADDAASGLPGATVSYVVTITNTGNVADSYDLSASANWTTTPSVASVTLNAGESTTFTVDVDIPGNAVFGDSDAATITATSQGDGTVTDTTTLTTSVEEAPPTYGVALSAAQDDFGAPAETVTYLVTITNTGSTTDTFDLSATGVWTTSLSSASVTLGAGESINFFVHVTVPGDAVDGDADDTVVTATSQGDATATDSTTLTTTAVITPEEGYTLYLPLIFK